MNRQHSSDNRRRGFTIIELVSSLAISSILLVAIGSAMMIVSRALPAADGPAATTLTTTDAATGQVKVN